MGVGDGVTLGVGLGGMGLGVVDAAGARASGCGVDVAAAAGAATAPWVGAAQPALMSVKISNSKKVKGCMAGLMGTGHGAPCPACVRMVRLAAVFLTAYEPEEQVGQFAQ